ncbi:hypothetical protein Pelo_18123 [Pelomyxa schiedti]|nr:hypothetical protein Pelo_18123 [Pelomyxa schiedti]
MRNGAPVSANGVGVKCTLPQSEIGARFSPFDPCGDELVVTGSYSTSIGAGVAVNVRESLSVPHPGAFDLVWSSPDTILTLHHDCGWSGYYRVYNTVTGELHTFPKEFYGSPYSVSDCQHIVFEKKDSPMCEVYRASSDMTTPCCQYHFNAHENFGSSSSTNDLYVVRRMDPSSSLLTTTLIHDDFTGTPLAFIRIDVDTD